MRHRSSILLFYSSDDTDFIRRVLAAAITHGLAQRRPIRSVQIPLGLEKAIRQRFHKKSVSSVKSVGQKTSTKKNLRHLRNLRDKLIAAPLGRQPLASGQISAKIRE